MTNSYDLIIDSREIAVKKELDKMGTVYITQQLDVGDMIITLNGRTIVIFERKTYTDLDSSIVSRRHQQQRQRLKEFQQTNGCMVAYILEGKPQDQPRLRGAIENLVFKHRFCVLPTASTKQTAELLQSAIKKYTNGDLFIDQDDRGCPTENQAGLWSRKSKIADNIFYHQLLVVPHVGEKLACTLAAEFENAGAFVDFCQDANAVIALGNKKVGARRIGTKTAQLIVSAFTIGKVTWE